ncbi:MAG: ATP-binding cassette domain-containing protein [Methanomassiliicoccaceae archaeon]|nr:ATP-binding cassette domain-containing protein [Methanomassiliicoccaceae archaeon]
MKNAVEFRNVSLVRSGNRILDSVTLDIAEGESVAIIGPNGSGKTSLMKIIKGDARPYRDENSETICRLFGEDRWNIFDLRNKMGVVSTDLQFRFNDTTSAGAVIMSGFFRTADVYKDHVITDAMTADAENAAERVGIADKLTRDIGKLSLGERRRVLIARALVPRPEMLLLDEPMTGLDIAVRTELRNILDDLMENGTSIIMITHDLEDIPTGIQRVIMMKDGRIFDDGPKDKILTPEKVSSLFSSDIKVTEENGAYRMMSF